MPVTEVAIVFHGPTVTAFRGTFLPEHDLALRFFVPGIVQGRRIEFDSL